MRTQILVTLLRLFSSCPGIFKLSGKIISDKTDNPIEGAKIELFDIRASVHLASTSNVYDQSFLSDTNGNFTASSIMRRMIFGLPTYQIRITKSGYQTSVININLKDKKIPKLFKLIEI
jgi:hypothetical protein